MSNPIIKGDKRTIRSWVFYDWANSVYTLTIASTIFPIFYGALFSEGMNTVNFLGFELKNTALISFITAFTFLVISVISPILSGVADYLGNKKTFMKFFCYTGALGCIGLYWFDLDSIHLSMLFYFMGLLGYWASLVFYNSYLPDIADPKDHDKISARGFSMGYVGSVLLLLLNLGMVMFPQFFGFDISIDEAIAANGSEEQIAEAMKSAKNAASFEAMKVSFVTVGLWWIIFSQYTFRYLPNMKTGKKMNASVLGNGWRELRGVWNQLKQTLRLKKYLRAFFVSSMAVQTIMLVAAYFGEQEIEWGDAESKTVGLIVSILIIQVIAILGAWLTAKASTKYGNVPTLIVVNSIWLMLCIVAYFVYTPIQFYFTAAFVGLVMGGVQALSRSTYSKFLPETRDTTSYFSFYDVAEKIGIVIGTAIYGIIDQVTGSMRLAVLVLVVFFIGAIFLLFKVPAKEVDLSET